jgi:hypothetical protein
VDQNYDWNHEGNAAFYCRFKVKFYYLLFYKKYTQINYNRYF